MTRWLSIAWFAIGALAFAHPAEAQRAQYEALVVKHAKANLVPADLVHRVIKRESGYRAELVGRGGTIGLMQIKLATARGLGYAGDAEGLRDPDTNLTYAVKYLAGAYRAANGDHDRAVHYYASGYYYVAKQQRLERPHIQAAPVLASVAAIEAAKPEQTAKPAPIETAAKPGPIVMQAAKPQDAARPDDGAQPEEALTFAERARPLEALAAANEEAKARLAAAFAKDIAAPKEVAAMPKETNPPANEIVAAKSAAARPKSATTVRREGTTPKMAESKPRRAPHKKLAAVGDTVPRPPASVPSGANSHH